MYKVDEREYVQNCVIITFSSQSRQLSVQHIHGFRIAMKSDVVIKDVVSMRKPNTNIRKFDTQFWNVLSDNLRMKFVWNFMNKRLLIFELRD